MYWPVPGWRSPRVRIGYIPLDKQGLLDDPEYKVMVDPRGRSRQGLWSALPVTQFLG